MKTLCFCIILLGGASAGLFAQAAPKHSPLDSLLASSADAKQKIVDELASQQNRSPDKELVLELNEELQESIKSSYSPANRQFLLQLTGRIHGPSSAPFLLAHLTYATQGAVSGGLGRGTFAAIHPYAEALFYYGEDEIPAILDANEKSKDPAFEKIAMETMVFMDTPVIRPLVRIYEKTAKDSKSALLLTDCLRELDSDSLVSTDIENEMGHVQTQEMSDRLSQLDSDLRIPQKPGPVWY